MPFTKRNKRSSIGGGGSSNKANTSSSSNKRPTRKKKSMPTPPSNSWALDKCAPPATVFLTGDMLTDNDVIFGRGSRVAQIVGNQKFRIHCWDFRQEYIMAKKTVKAQVALKVIAKLALLDPPCRFVERQVEDKPATTTTTSNSPSATLLFQTVSPERSLEKVCQTLREQKSKPPVEFLAKEKEQQETAAAVGGPTASAVTSGTATRKVTRSKTRNWSSSSLPKSRIITTTTMAATTCTMDAAPVTIPTVKNNKMTHKNKDKVPVKKSNDIKAVLVLASKEKPYPTKTPRKKLVVAPPLLGGVPRRDQDGAAPTEKDDTKQEAKGQRFTMIQHKVSQQGNDIVARHGGGKVQELLKAAAAAATAVDKSRATIAHNKDSCHNSNNISIACPLTLLDQKFADVPPQLTVFESGMYSVDSLLDKPLIDHPKNNSGDMETAAKKVVATENQVLAITSTVSHSASPSHSSHSSRSKSIMTMRLLLQGQQQLQQQQKVEGRLVTSPVGQSPYVNKMQEENHNRPLLAPLAVPQATTTMTGPTTTTTPVAMDMDVVVKPPEFYPANSLFLDDDDFIGDFPILSKDHGYSDQHGRDAKVAQAPSPNGAMDVMDFVEPPPPIARSVLPSVETAVAATTGCSSFLPKRALFPKELQYAHEMSNASRRLLLHPGGAIVAAAAAAAVTNHVPRDLTDVFQVHPTRHHRSSSLTDVDMELLEYIQPPDFLHNEFHQQSKRALDFFDHDTAPVHHHYYESPTPTKTSSMTTLWHPGAPTITPITTAIEAVTTKLFADAAAAASGGTTQLNPTFLDTQLDFELLPMNHHQHHHHAFPIPHDMEVGDHHDLDVLFDDDDYRPVHEVRH